MKRLLFLLLIYTSTITTLTRTAAAAGANYHNDDLLTDACILCGTEKDETPLTSLCPKAPDHSLCCKRCTPELRKTGKCASCLQPFNTQPEDKIVYKDLKPEDLKERIIKERIDISTGRIEIMQRSLEEYKRGRRTPSNRQMIRYLENGITETEKQKAGWQIITAICAYAQAWNAIKENPANEVATNKVGEILTDHTDYEVQEAIHLIGSDSGRLTDLFKQTERALKHSEGSDGDVLPNLLELRRKAMTVESSF